MSTRSAVYAGALMAVATFMSGTALADDIIVETAPPAVQTETIPSDARPGYVWAAGYQKWDGGNYTYVPGHWVEAQVHSHWVADNWEKMDDTHWRFHPGHWVQE